MVDVLDDADCPVRLVVCSCLLMAALHVVPYMGHASPGTGTTQEFRQGSSVAWVTRTSSAKRLRCPTLGTYGGGMRQTAGIGTTIRVKLTERGLTLRATANLTGISRSTLHRITSGQVDPKLGQLSKLAEVLGTTVDELLAAKGK